MHTIADPELLTEEQLDLIRATAANRGTIVVQMSSRTAGRAVCAGRKSFFDREDRAVAKRYIDALHELVQLQVLRNAVARENYELTNSGWQISRKLS